MGDFSRQLAKKVDTLDPYARKLLTGHSFPGNVRQLRNLVEQAVILAKGRYLTPDLLPGLQPLTASLMPVAPYDSSPNTEDESLGARLAALEGRRRELNTIERRIIEDALTQADGNKTHAAKLLGMSRYALLRRVKKLEDEM